MRYAHQRTTEPWNKLHTWARVWQMDFNITKCAVVSVTTTKKPFLHDYLMDGQQIPRCENQDYLGVTINHKLSWKPHITKIKNKANRTLGLIRRTLHAAPQQVRKQTYEALVRPTLEYTTYVLGLLTLNWTYNASNRSNEQLLGMFVVRWSKGDYIHDTPMVCRVGGILCCVCR